MDNSDMLNDTAFSADHEFDITRNNVPDEVDPFKISWIREQYARWGIC